MLYICCFLLFIFPLTLSISIIPCSQLKCACYKWHEMWVQFDQLWLPVKVNVIVEYDECSFWVQGYLKIEHSLRARTCCGIQKARSLHNSSAAVIVSWPFLAFQYCPLPCVCCYTITCTSILPALSLFTNISTLFKPILFHIQAHILQDLMNIYVRYWN